MSQADRGRVVLETVGPDNLGDCGIGCLSNRKHPGYSQKVGWLEKRFAEGLRLLLFRDADGKPLAFLEHVPGECAWRPVDADGWLFVHCLWVYKKGLEVGGLGSRLIEACVAEAVRSGARGVAAMVSDGPWMAGKDIFLKNGFEVVAEADRFELVVHRLKDGPLPSFRNVEGNRARYEGLHVVYSEQCPMLPKSIADVAALAEEHGLELNVTVLDTAEKAQRAPSYYGVYSLLWNGRLLSEHYVSGGRFKGLLRKEILNDPQ